jgi:hypothetical protein
MRKFFPEQVRVHGNEEADRLAGSAPVKEKLQQFKNGVKRFNGISCGVTHTKWKMYT